MSGKQRPFALMLLVVATVLTACGSTPSPSPSVTRPSSPAVVTIVQPAAGQTVSGTVHVVLSLTGAKIVPQTSTNIRPDEGHVHLFVDNVLKSMNYGLEQDLQLPSGTYVLSAEFVAADHAPFNPRVVSAQTIFTVQ